VIQPCKFEVGITIPKNARVDETSVVTGDDITAKSMFKRFRSERNPALVIGQRCRIDGVMFNLGKNGFIEIGDDCYLGEAVLACELEIRVGSRVVMGWHATIMDCDLHPLDPHERQRDVIALSPLGAGSVRPQSCAQPVIIGDDVWIGPNALILKGVQLGRGAKIEPGSVVTSDVPAGLRVVGNPARAMAYRE